MLLRVCFYVFSSRCVEQKTARLHGGTVPRCSSPVLWATHVLTRYQPACLSEKWHCKVHLRRWAGNDTLTVWLQWQWRLNLWFVFSTFPDRCLSNTSFDKVPLSLKLFSLKALEIKCCFICFRVKHWFQSIDLGHHVLLETSNDNIWYHATLLTPGVS